MFLKMMLREPLRFEGEIRSDLLYISKQNKANFKKRAEIPVATSGHL